MLRLTGALTGALILAGCATTAIGPAGLTVPTVDAPGYELVDTTIRAVNVDRATQTTGASNTIHLSPDGTAHAVIDGTNQAVPGRWGIRGRELCFNWPVRGTECWPYASAMQVGQTVRLTSDRGVTADITLLRRGR